MDHATRDLSATITDDYTHRAAHRPDAEFERLLALSRGRRILDPRFRPSDPDIELCKRHLTSAQYQLVFDLLTAPERPAESRAIAWGLLIGAYLHAVDPSGAWDAARGSTIEFLYDQVTERRRRMHWIDATDRTRREWLRKIGWSQPRGRPKKMAA